MKVTLYLNVKNLFMTFLTSLASSGLLTMTAGLLNTLTGLGPIPNHAPILAFTLTLPIWLAYYTIEDPISRK